MFRPSLGHPQALKESRSNIAIAEIVIDYLVRKKRVTAPHESGTSSHHFITGGSSLELTYTERRPHLRSSLYQGMNVHIRILYVISVENTTTLF
jgi:hypothetical protein